jgi:hypothetical protein
MSLLHQAKITHLWLVVLPHIHHQESLLAPKNDQRPLEPQLRQARARIDLTWSLNHQNLNHLSCNRGHTRPSMCNLKLHTNKPPSVSTTMIKQIPIPCSHRVGSSLLPVPTQHFLQPGISFPGPSLRLRISIPQNPTNVSRSRHKATG